jgi:hypothetical protein
MFMSGVKLHSVTSASVVVRKMCLKALAETANEMPNHLEALDPEYNTICS